MFFSESFPTFTWTEGSPACARCPCQACRKSRGFPTLFPPPRVLSVGTSPLGPTHSSSHQAQVGCFIQCPLFLWGPLREGKQDQNGTVWVLSLDCPLGGFLQVVPQPLWTSLASEGVRLITSQVPFWVQMAQFHQVWVPTSGLETGKVEAGAWSGVGGCPVGMLSTPG